MSQLAVTIREPSGLNDAEATHLVCPLSVSTSALLLASQTFAVLSKLPVTTRESSAFGDRAKAGMHLVELAIDFAQRFHRKCGVRRATVRVEHAVHPLPHLFFGPERVGNLAVQQFEPQFLQKLAVRADHEADAGAEVQFRFILPEPKPGRSCLKVRDGRIVARPQLKPINGRRRAGSPSVRRWCPRGRLASSSR